ncbi:MAG: hypothetical protein H6551_09835 [Chitinophagales bacterium]|nr:hypothetical protein [Chitinophagaceae bacterium]MCB9065425.1 hypothetical protein [Chitinophagales bacterium]
MYHLLIIAQVVPFDAIWGGRLTNEEEMYRFEMVSIILNIVILMVIAIKGGYIRRIKPNRTIRVLLWLLVVLYIFNTIGNILSTNILEAAIFTPITLISALLCWRMAIE